MTPEHDNITRQPARRLRTNVIRASGRFIRRFLIGTALFILLLGILLQIPPVSLLVARSVLNLVNPWPGTVASIGSAGGSWFSSLSLTNIRIASASDSLFISIDTLRASYDLSALLGGTLHFRQLSISRPTVRTRLLPGGNLVLLQPFASSDTASQDTSEGLRVRGDTLQLTNGECTLLFPSDTTFRQIEVHDIHLRGDSILIGGGITASIDTLHCRAAIEGQRAGEFRVDAAGTLSGSSLDVRSLSIASARSRIVGRGYVPLPFSPVHSLPGTNLRLSASPVSYADLHLLLPGFGPEGEARVDLGIAGNGDSSFTNLTLTFPGGGNIGLTGKARAMPGRILALDFTGASERFSPSSLTGPPDTSESLRSRFRVIGTGSSPADFSGSANVEVLPSRVADIGPVEGTLNAEARQGNIRATVRGDVGPILLNADVRLTTFDPVPEYAVKGTLTILHSDNPENLLERLGGLVSEFSLSGRGFDPDSARAHATLKGTWSANPYCTSLLVQGTFVCDTLRASGELGTGTGFVRTTAEAIVREVPLYRIRVPEFRTISLAVFGSTIPATSLTGSLQAEVSGASLAELTGTASLRLDSSHFASISVQDLRTDITIEHGQVRATASAASDAGAISFQCVADPFAASPFLTLEESMFRGIDLGKILGTDDLSSDLNGSVQIHAEARSMRDLSLVLDGSLQDGGGAVQAGARVSLDSSTVNRQKIRDATIAMTLLDGSLETSVEIRTPDGGLTGHAHARPFDQTPSLSVPALHLNHLDIGALTGRNGLRTDLTGTLAGALQGELIESATGNLSVDLLNSTVNAATLQRGSLQATMEGGPLSVHGRADFTEGRAALEATGRVTRGGMRGKLSLDISSSNFAPLLDADSLFPSALVVRGLLEGTWGPPAETDFRATLLGRGSYHDFKVDTLVCGLSVHGRTIVIDTAQLITNVGSLTAEGTLVSFDSMSSSYSDLSFSASASSFQPLEHILGIPPTLLRSATVSLHASGPPEMTEIQCAADLDIAAAGDLAITSLQASMDGRFGPSLKLESVQGNAELSGFQYGAFALENASVTLHTIEGRHEIAALIRFDRHFSVSLGGTAYTDPDSVTVRIDSLVARSLDQTWVLERPATISYGARFIVRDFALHAGSRDLIIDGILDPQGEQNFTVVADSMNLGNFAKVFGRTDLEGLLFANLRIEGPAGGAHASGRISARVREAGRPIGDFLANLDWHRQVLSIDGKIDQPGGGILTISAMLPVELSLRGAAAEGNPESTQTKGDGSVDVLLTADRFNFNFLRPFLSSRSISSLEGILTANIHATGSLGSLMATGGASIDSGRIGISPLGVVYSAVRLRCTAQGRELRIENAEAASGEGTLRWSGTLDLDDPMDPKMNLEIAAQQFLAAQTPVTKANLSGSLQVEGTVSAPTITGSLLINESYFVIPETIGSSSVEAVNLTADDYAMLAEHFGYRPRVVAPRHEPSTVEPTLDLTLEIAQNTWIRKRINPTLAIELNGRVRVLRSPGQPIRLSGTLRPVTGRSYVGQFGRQFEITGGEIVFGGIPQDLELHIDSEYKVPSKGGSGLSEVVIRMKVQSRLGRFTFSLTSDPAMDESEILSYLTTGQSRAGALANTADQGGLAGAMALEQLVGVAGGLTEGSVPIDVFQIRQDGARGITIVAGNYVNPKTYMGIRQPILINQGTQETYYDTRTQFELEYEAQPWLFLNFQGGSSRLLLFLKARHAY